MIRPLSDPEAFRSQRREAWARNSPYWLSQPLRHVIDVGDYIADRISTLCRSSDKPTPLVIDMGCGSCWLLDALQSRQVKMRYIGVDNNPDFIEAAESRYHNQAGVSFSLTDLDMAVDLGVEANVIVNAFNFFELADLRQAMRNVTSWLANDGTLLMSTIDKTYLILALSRNWEEFHDNLRRYQGQTGTQYDFQKIDLGDGLSDSLEYPSVLYTTEDFIEAARANGLGLTRYVEQPFTAKVLPKIYCHIEFQRIHISCCKGSMDD